MESQKFWLALDIGNSRLHWGLFAGETLTHTWDTKYINPSIVQEITQYTTLNDLLQEVLPSHDKFLTGTTDSSTLSPPMLLASVVPNQTRIWEAYPEVQILTLEQIPLLKLYPTLGMDRALAVCGAGKKWGFPTLVIDSGTAITLTGVDGQQSLVGGAIMPGVGLQFHTLSKNTGELPQVTRQISSLPPRFALNTNQAIESGVIYTILAGIRDFVIAWWQLFPSTKIVIKGGDRLLINNYLKSYFRELADLVVVDNDLIFWGMREIFKQCYLNKSSE